MLSTRLCLALYVCGLYAPVSWWSRVSEDNSDETSSATAGSEFEDVRFPKSTLYNENFHAKAWPLCTMSLGTTAIIGVAVFCRRFTPLAYRASIRGYLSPTCILACISVWNLYMLADRVLDRISVFVDVIKGFRFGHDVNLSLKKEVRTQLQECFDRVLEKGMQVGLDSKTHELINSYGSNMGAFLRKAGDELKTTAKSTVADLTKEGGALSGIAEASKTTSAALTSFANEGLNFGINQTVREYLNQCGRNTGNAIDKYLAEGVKVSMKKEDKECLNDLKKSCAGVSDRLFQEGVTLHHDTGLRNTATAMHNFITRSVGDIAKDRGATGPTASTSGAGWPSTTCARRHRSVVDVTLSAIGGDRSPVDSSNNCRRPESAVLGETNPESAVLGETNPESAVLGETNPESAVLGETNDECFFDCECAYEDYGL